MAEGSAVASALGELGARWEAATDYLPPESLVAMPEGDCYSYWPTWAGIEEYLRRFPLASWDMCWVDPGDVVRNDAAVSERECEDGMEIS